MTQLKPGILFSPATMTSRRRRNSATILADSVWSPLIAAMPAICVKAAVHELLLTMSLVTHPEISVFITP